MIEKQPSDDLAALRPLTGDELVQVAGGAFSIISGPQPDPWRIAKLETLTPRIDVDREFFPGTP